MANQYRIEICQEIIVPVELEADNEQEAIDTALQARGIAGDSYYRETKVIRVTEIEG